jgi:hypothetical protein
MTKSRAYAVLNRLLTIVHRSLPIYLADASPWTHEGDEKAVKALQLIVEQQHELANRIANYIIDHFGPANPGEYPADFPDTHDLSLDYLMGKLVQCQKADVDAAQACVNELHSERQAHALAEEALGAARGHLETLEELAATYSKHSGWAR